MLTLPLSKGCDNVAHMSMAAALSVIPFGVGLRVRLANTSLAMAVAGQVQGTRASLGFLTLRDACANCMQCMWLLHTDMSVLLYLVLPAAVVHPDAQHERAFILNNFSRPADGERRELDQIRV